MLFLLWRAGKSLEFEQIARTESVEYSLRITGDEAHQPCRSPAREPKVEKIILGSEIQKLIAKPLKRGQKIAAAVNWLSHHPLRLLGPSLDYMAYHSTCEHYLFY
jgi:hypothetical protein